jgi:hypothetical protein
MKRRRSAQQATLDGFFRKRPTLEPSTSQAAPIMTHQFLFYALFIPYLSMFLLILMPQYVLIMFIY